MAEGWDHSGFVHALNAIVNVLEERLLPDLEDEKIDTEANRIKKEEWERLMSMPSTGDEDPSYLADKAINDGNLHFIMMYEMRQGMLNLFAVALHHAFEQQLQFFFWKLTKKNSSVLPRLDINTEIFSSWSKIDELRLVANTVKHAEGDSANKLRKIRLDMFRHPLFSPDFSPRFDSAFQPLFGDGLYVSLRDIKDYRDHLVRFWQELGDRAKFCNKG